jgi:hypothetical protein
MYYTGEYHCNDTSDIDVKSLQEKSSDEINAKRGNILQL